MINKQEKEYSLEIIYKDLESGMPDNKSIKEYALPNARQLLGGRFVGETTLLRFYVLHCIAIPFIAMIFMAVHFWRIRKDGGISGPM